jgi:hypothetical protein
MPIRVRVGLGLVFLAALAGWAIDGGTGAAVVSVVVLVALPPRYDPAVWLKERGLR